MAPTSKILILTICSLNKLPGGTSKYNEQDAIVFGLPEDTGELLLRTRERVRRWLRRSKSAEWQGVPVSELEYNQNLVCGRDFGGNDAEARYFPALGRYEGRFYQTLGGEGRRSLQNSRHHILILSGLYGLLTPMEPIQLYSCPVDGNSKVASIWTEGDTLTNILLSYIQEHKISRVFDLTAVSAYRRLISWPAIRSEAKGGVLHCVGSMAAGDYLLIPFAHLMKDFLLQASEDELLSVSFGTRKDAIIQDVWFHKTPRSGKPREMEPVILDLADKLERKRRAIIRFLDRVEGHSGNYREKVGERVRRLEGENKIKAADAEAMRVIMRTRNNVVFREEYEPSARELSDVKNAWKHLSARIKKRS